MYVENPYMKLIYVVTFYIRGSVHHNCRSNKSNEMQRHADIYLLLNYSTCLGRPSRLSSGVHKTVPEAATTVLHNPDDGRDGRPKHVD